MLYNRASEIGESISNMSCISSRYSHTERCIASLQHAEMSAAVSLKGARRVRGESMEGLTVPLQDRAAACRVLVNLRRLRANQTVWAPEELSRSGRVRRLVKGMWSQWGARHGVKVAHKFLCRLHKHRPDSTRPTLSAGL